MVICAASIRFNLQYMKEALLFLIAIEALLIISFLVLDVFFFYLAFESVLIPMFFLVGLWGSRAQRVKAAYYLFFFTLASSVMMLVAVLTIYVQTGTTNLLHIVLSPHLQNLLWIPVFLAFAVKTPMWPLHGWLPEAHVEAPTAGSVILAGLLLKLGGYGFVRFMTVLFTDPAVNRQYWPVTVALGVSSVIFASLTALRQVDMKRIIAYSSIAHMSLAVLGVFANNIQGLQGAMYLMLAHGFVSSALFLLIGVLYDRYHSRFIRHYGGLAQVMPMYAIFFLLFTLANIGFPLTYNFLSEFLVFAAVFREGF